jgi:outer membrane protein
MNWTIKTLAFVALASFQGTSFAQDSLSARQAVFTALENNFDILIAEKQEDIAKMNNAWSEAGLFPTVTLQVGQNNLIQDNTNNPFTFTPGVILNQSFNPSLSANMNLFSGFQVRINKQRLEQMEAQSQGNTAVVIEALIADVLRTYYNALLQRERMDLMQTIMANSERRLKYAEIKNKYSASNTLELLQLKNQYLTDSTNYLLQELSYGNSLRNLQLLMNNKEDQNNETLPLLSDSLDFLLDEIDQSAARRDMMSNNQNLKNQYIALELQQSAVDLQRSFLYPTVGLNLAAAPSFGRFEQLSGAQPGQLSSISTQAIAYTGGITLRYNIYNNWKGKRAVEVAKIQQEIGDFNLEKLKRSLNINLTNVLGLYSIRKGLVNVSRENLVYATKAYDLAQKRYDLGAINSIDLLVLQTNYQNTLIQHYENLYNRLDSYLEVYRMTGKLQLSYQ